MKKYLLPGLILLLISSYASGQHWSKDHEQQRERIASFKIAFITEQLMLTPDEAEKFWPLYHEFEGKRVEEQDEILGIGPESRHPDPATMSDEELDQFIINKLNQEQKLIDLKLEYFEKFKEVISVRKVFLLYQSEMEFRKVLLERVRNTRSPR